jgi:hypothetical protein
MSDRPLCAWKIIGTRRRQTRQAMHFAVVQKEEEFFIPGYQITCQDAPAERGHSLINIFFLPLQLVI